MKSENVFFRKILLLLFLLLWGCFAGASDRPNIPGYLIDSWKTDWTKHSIDYDELFSGGPPRDGIPPIDTPKFIPAKEGKKWLNDVEPVIFLQIGEKVKAYPIQILMWHEIVNDTLNNVPVSVTFCPLCNSAIVFDRRLEGKLYDFGTSGLLRFSDLVMYDRQTESLWQQFTGEGIVGEMTGKELKMLPASIISFKEFHTAWPNAPLLSRDTGYFRRYGRNPYPGYDDVNQSPFLFFKQVDDRLLAMSRVVTVSNGNLHKAYPLKKLAKKGVIQDRLGSLELVVFHTSETASALDSSVIERSRKVGSTAVYSPTVNGKGLTFAKDKKGFFDRQTGSRWNILGTATAGKLKGNQLTAIVHADHFWFSWAAFRPDTEVY